MPARGGKEIGEIDSLFNLSLSLHHLNKDMERKFKVSLVQLFVLLRLRSLPASNAHALSMAIGIQPSTLSQTIQRLERKEYIFVTYDPRDSRKKLISLTRRGKEAIEVVQCELKAIFGGLNRETDNHLEATLKYLVRFSKFLQQL